jgi:F-type H+-transporting ATPase subunit b
LKKILLLGLALAPLGLFASSEGAVESDIVQRTVNFIIFAGILWYLLADKIQAFLADRTSSIQSELDKVEDTLKASKDKAEAAAKKLEEAKVIAIEIVETSKSEIDAVKQKVADAVETEIANLGKGFDDKIKVERSKAKRETVSLILDQLLSSDNLSLTQDELVNIVVKKVA